MSQEIIEGIQAIEKEKGIEEGVLITASRTHCVPHTRRHPARPATPRFSSTTRASSASSDRDPEDIEIRLVEEAREARITELEQLEEETGERQHTLITDEDLELDWSQVPPEQIVRTDVTPDNSDGSPRRPRSRSSSSDPRGRARDHVRGVRRPPGRGRDRIVQQAGDRNNVLVDLGAWNRCSRAPSRSTASATSRGRIKAVIAEVRSGTKGRR